MATLLDLKAARLLPSAGEIEEPEDLGPAREAFATCSSPRLLQYRAYKTGGGLRRRSLRPEQQRPAAPRCQFGSRFAALLPEVVLDVTPERFAALAAALTPARRDVISLRLTCTRLW